MGAALLWLKKVESMKQNPYLLIVDDDPDDVDFLTDAFNARFPDVRFAYCENGSQAIVFMRAANQASDCPDIMFLDLHMPKKTAMKHCWNLRKQTNVRHAHHRNINLATDRRSRKMPPGRLYRVFRKALEYSGI
jgi:CheY-like chemotaxis protein